VVPRDRLAHGVDQPGPALALGGDGHGVVADLDPRPGGEALDSVGEVEVLDLPHEGDDVAPLPAAEAVVQPLLGVDGERRRLLGVERAQALPLAPHRLQGDVLPGHGHEVGGGPDPLDVLGEDAHARPTVVAR
jgi:hypothetical protein